MKYLFLILLFAGCAQSSSQTTENITEQLPPLEQDPGLCSCNDQQVHIKKIQILQEQVYELKELNKIIREQK